MITFALMLWLSASFSPIASSYNILGIFPVEAKSHFSFIDPLMVRLAEKGHKITSFNAFPKKSKIINYTDVDIKGCYTQKHITTESLDSIFEKTKNPHTLPLRLAVWDFGLEKFEKCAPLMQLLKSTEKYDLLITESFVSDFPLLFAKKFEIPVVTFVPNTLLPRLTPRMANPSNPSYITNPYTDRLYNTNFLERLDNTVLYLEAVITYYLWNLRNDQKVFERVLDKSTTVYDVIKNTSVMFTNSHGSLSPAFPTVPGVVQVGGMHIQPVVKLPKVCYIVWFFIGRVLLNVFSRQRRICT